MVECNRWEAPRLAIQIDIELIQLAQISILQERPREMQRHPSIKQHLAENTVTRPMVIGELIQFVPSGRVLIRSSLERSIRKHKPRSTMREHHIRNLRLSSNIVGLAVVEAGQPGQDCRPREVRIGLHEDKPLRVRLVAQGFLGHGQELPFIQFPAWVVGLADVGVCFVGEIVLLETLAALRADAVVDFEVGDTRPHLGIHCTECIVDLDALDFLFKIGVYHEVGDAAEGCGEVNGHFIACFGDTGFHDHEHIVDAIERGTEGSWFAEIVDFIGGSGASCQVGLEGEDVVEEEEGNGGCNGCESAAKSATGNHPVF